MGLLIVGCGDIGLRVARTWPHSPVIGVVRRAEGEARLRSAGVIPWRLDLDDSLATPYPQTTITTLIYLAPPPSSGEDDSRLQRLLALLPLERLPRRLLYLSTSGVYGDQAGAWVTEETPPQPQTARARRRLAAERRIVAFAGRQGVESVILRVGGIYGPGRLPLARIERGEPVVRDSECGYSNRIHADDLAQVIVTAALRAPAGALYNVADGQPSSMTDYLLAVADRAGLPHPPEISLAQARQQLSPAMLSYLTESRRLDIRRLQKDLGVVLRYPDLATGLAACDL